MADVLLYTTEMCPYCYRAKKLLTEKGVDFTEIDVGMDVAKRREMTSRAEGRTTVPQIFIAGRGIGGCDELYALEQSGELDRLLAAA